jgi:hypothetical protein
MTDAEDRDIALERLAKFTQPDVEPTLDELELEDILDESARAVRWTTATVLTIGTLVLPTVYNGHVYKVITGGTTTTEPTWPESQAGTVNLGAEFEEAGLYTFSSLYDVRAALRKCWELKAAKASELISSSDSGSEQVIFQHCQEMASKYVTPIIA